MKVKLSELVTIEAAEFELPEKWPDCPTTTFPAGKDAKVGRRYRPECGVAVLDDGGCYLLEKIEPDGTGVFRVLVKPRSIVYGDVDLAKGEVEVSVTTGEMETIPVEEKIGGIEVA